MTRETAAHPPAQRDVENVVSSDEEAHLVADAAGARPVRRVAVALAAAAAVVGAAGAASALAGRRPALEPALQLSASEAKVAGVVSLAEADATTCTEGLDNCNVTKCCASPGMTCFQQDGLYAQCRGTCTPGPDPSHWDGKPWTCQALGDKTEGEDPCADPGMDCRQSKCCRQPGHVCFEKNEGWATCKGGCIPGGPDFGDVDGEPWSCKKLGEAKPGAAPWVAEQCAAGWDNCVQKGCCKNPGEICYKQNDYFGECKVACSDAGWNCGTVGVRTPGPPPKVGRLPKWAWDKCSGLNKGCKDSRCCIGMDVQCYEKDDTWAQCKETCQPGVHGEDGNSTWSCRELGPRSYGVTTKGFPSLYCFSVIRTVGYEPGLLQAQQAAQAGIFTCDDFSILSADATTTIGDVKTVQFQGAPIIKSIDNTAGNTWLFVHAWETVIGLNKWRNHTFTLKVDPDAVLIADRIRAHLLPHVGEKMYVVNCPVGDMMYGAVEVFSYHAVREWWLRGHSCNSPNNWGEDKYMTNCMDNLGVARVHDTNIVADNLCLGSDCGNTKAAAFHPYKDVGSWLACWNRAMPTAPQETVIHFQRLAK